MSTTVRLCRSVRIPDPIRVERAQRIPELGPRILFVSGGSALRPLSRVLKKYTHQSIHLITPFDSGGSSAKLRSAFDMLSVGDLRNRLMSLADETVRGSPEIYELFAHRLPKDLAQDELLRRLRSMVEGEHDLVAAVLDPMRTIVRTHLRFFLDNMPARFDLAGASIGNLMLAGGYLAHDRDIDSVVFLFSKLVEVRGIVRPVADADLHLGAVLRSGDRVVGQHLITGKEAPPLESSIQDLYLVESLDQPRQSSVPISRKIRRLIRSADLLCYPIGSFYSSVIANLLPAGMGRSICEAGGPKVYVANSGPDPEQGDMSVQDCVEQILRFVRRDAGEDQPVEQILDLVIVDKKKGRYGADTDWDAVEALGVPVLDLDLVRPDEGGRHDPQALAESLLSLA